MASDRVQAMGIVFERSTDKLRQELEIEIGDLNSKLISRRLISESVMEAKNIDTTLKAMRSTLRNKDNAERAFEGFMEAVSEITSKSHLAKDMSKAFQEMISLPYPVSAVIVLASKWDLWLLDSLVAPGKMEKTWYRLSPQSCVAPIHRKYRKLRRILQSALLTMNLRKQWISCQCNHQLMETT